MSIVIDILIVLILVAVAFIFTRIGFTKTVYHVGKSWVSLFTSMIVGPFISDSIRALFLSDTITNGICNTLTKTLDNSPTGQNIQALFANLPDGFISFLEWFNISLPELEATYGSATQPSHDMLMEISRLIATPLASFTASILGHIVSFLIPFFAVAWLKRIQIKNTELAKDPNIQSDPKKMKKLARVHLVDKILGCVVGIAIGSAALIAASILTHTVFQVIIAFNGHSDIMAVYDNSYVFKFLVNIDIVGIISQLFS